jgi:mycothiol synthase
MDDIKETIHMLNTWSRRTLDVEKFELPEMEVEWRTPGFDLHNDTRLVIAPDDKIAAYYELWDLNDPHTRVHIWGRVHPEHTNLGLGTALLEWAIERAHLAIPKAPVEARVTLLAHCLSTDEPAQELFRDNDFSLIRHSLRMVINLNGYPPEPVLPDGITIRPMVVGQDERAIVQADRESFQDHWGHIERPFEDEFARWMHFMENSDEFDPALWFLAMDGDQVAGISLCDPKADDDPEMGWVSTLGVRRPWRRRGLGLALLQHSFRAFHRLGKERVGLGVDAENLTGATRLYRKASMQPDPQRQYSLYELELRPGVELSTQTVED